MKRFVAIDSSAPRTWTDRHNVRHAMRALSKYGVTWVVDCGSPNNGCNFRELDETGGVITCIECIAKAR